jgi:hypothetical protein
MWSSVCVKGGGGQGEIKMAKLISWSLLNSDSIIITIFTVTSFTMYNYYLT